MRSETKRRDRDCRLAMLGDTRFDLVIVGGGITGAALAALASAGPRPLRVALIEAAELASGTSSRSSKLLHGGLRYLAQGRVGLVRRLLRGRAEIATLAPHLVSPAPFLLPIGPATPHAAWALRTALGAYGALERWAPHAMAGAPPRHLDRGSVRGAEPLAAALATGGALSYGELAVDDAGLVEELGRRAVTAGAVILTHVACEGFVHAGNTVVGVHARDRISGATFVVRGRAVADATGPWSGRLRRLGRLVCGDGRVGDTPSSPSPLRLSRGTHILIHGSRLPLSQTLVFFAPGDRRALFASPRGAHVLIGTTEVEHHGSPDDVTPTHEEVAYLVDAAAAAMPDAGLRIDAVVGAFAGVRPLVAGNGEVGALDRRYVLAWDEPGVLAIRGGKLTLALDGARRALLALRAEARALGLPAITVPPVGILSADAPLARRAARMPARKAPDWRTA